MCYTTYFSTDSPENLNEVRSEYFEICAIEEVLEVKIRELLRYPHPWYLMCRYGGCSCHYRHASEGDLEFRPIEEWSSEDQDDGVATQAFYDLLQRLVSEGHSVDIVDLWNDEVPGELQTIEVKLSEVPREGFRFFENKKFELTA